MTPESLSPRTIGYWRVAAFTRACFYSVPFLAYGFMSSIAGSAGPMRWLPFVGAGAVLVGGLLWTALAPAIRYSRYRFARTGSRLWIRSGVIVHREKSIPLARIQHLDVSRGPIERVFGLAHLTVYTSGGRAATALIPGLDPDRADRLREELLAATEALIQSEADGGGEAPTAPQPTDTNIGTNADDSPSGTATPASEQLSTVRSHDEASVDDPEADPTSTP